MNLLKCLICQGELEVLGSIGFIKKIKCICCGYMNTSSIKKEPEVMVYRKKY